MRIPRTAERKMTIESVASMPESLDNPADDAQNEAGSSGEKIEESSNPNEAPLELVPVRYDDSAPENVDLNQEQNADGQILLSDFFNSGAKWEEKAEQVVRPGSSAVWSDFM